MRRSLGGSGYWSTSRSLNEKSVSGAEEHLPTSDPLSQAAMREQRRLKWAESTVHFIPVVLVLCAIVLWFFSNFETNNNPEVEL